jgi:hypothetical protein
MKKNYKIGLVTILLLMPITLQAAPLLLSPKNDLNSLNKATAQDQTITSFYSLNPETVAQLWHGDINSLTLPVNGQDVEFHQKERIVRKKNVTWRGVDDSGYITVLLTLGQDHVYGQISGQFGVISIASNSTELAAKDTESSGLVDVKLLDPSKEVEIDDGALVPPEAGSANQKQKEQSLSNTTAAEDGSRIDVMVLYTNGMAAAYPGDQINTRIQYLIDQGNLSFSNSQINTQFNLVHSAMVIYTDDSTGDMDEALDDLTNNTGVFSNVEALRTTYGADQVVLLRRFVDEGCGLAWIHQSSRPDLAYAVVHNGFKTDNSGYYCSDLTYAHEIGHNLGCMHDRDHAGLSTGRYSYSYGYQSPTKSFRTVMSYDCPGGCPRITNFSNPAIQYGGEATGVFYTAANSADNARTINQTRVDMANYREAVIWTVTPSVGTNGSISPNTTQTVNHGETASFTVTADAGYTTDPTVGGSCPTGSWSGSIYTTGAVTANCSVSFSFVDNSSTWTVTPNAGTGGSMSPSTVQTVNTGQTVGFTLTPAKGYTIKSVTGCNGTLNRGSNIYTTGAIFSNCTVTASFNHPISQGVHLLLDN